MQLAKLLPFRCNKTTFFHVYIRVKNKTDFTHPKLGIFWFLPTRTGHRFVGLAHDVARVDLIGGFKTIEEGHADTWAKVVAADRSLSRYGYEHFPRGRVNWCEEGNTFLLLADAAIFGRNLHKVVIDRWNLGKETVRLLTDSHYRTNKLPSLISRGGRS